MSYGISRNHVCFDCRHTARAYSQVTLTCPFCRKHMVFLHKGFSGPPPKDDVKAWRKYFLSYEQCSRSYLVQDLDDKAYYASFIGKKNA